MAVAQARNVVQRLWSYACDGCWHSSDELAERMRLSRRDIEMVMEFFVRYGFAESPTRLARKYRIKTFAPSPFEVARILQSIYTSGIQELAKAHRFLYS